MGQNDTFLNGEIQKLQTENESLKTQIKDLNILLSGKKDGNKVKVLSDILVYLRDNVIHGNQKQVDKINDALGA